MIFGRDLRPVKIVNIHVLVTYVFYKTVYTQSTIYACVIHIYIYALLSNDHDHTWNIFTQSVRSSY